LIDISTERDLPGLLTFAFLMVGRGIRILMVVGRNERNTFSQLVH
jgi:hypothetical protein